MMKQQQIATTVQPKQKAKTKAKAKGKPRSKRHKPLVGPTDIQYQQLFDTCIIKTEKIAAVDEIINNKILANRNRYEDISTMVKTGGKLENQTFFSSPSLFRTRPLFDAFPGNAVTPFPTLPEPLFQQPLTDTLPDLSVDLTPKFDPFRVSFMRQLTNNISFVSNGRIPWYFIACVHYLECSFSFKRHLHNGDPLTGYTVQVPPGRPKVGHPPPFTFEESAIDALKLLGFDKVTAWKLPFIMRNLEAYNGFGYFLYFNINSPYLWSFSNHYTKGKYVRDREFNKDAVSGQVGAAVILKRMEERSLIYIPRF